MANGLKTGDAKGPKAEDENKKPEDEKEPEDTESPEEDPDEDKKPAEEDGREPEENPKKEPEDDKDEPKAAAKKPGLFARALEAIGSAKAKDQKIAKLEENASALENDLAAARRECKRLEQENSELNSRLKSIEEFEQALKEEAKITDGKLGARASAVVASLGLSEEKLPEGDGPQGEDGAARPKSDDDYWQAAKAHYAGIKTRS